GMIRSFQYAGLTVLTELLRSARLGKSDFEAIEPWARLWDTWASWAFLRAYIESAGGAPFVPKDRAELRTLLEAFHMENAIYELGYELNNRPDWVQIPAQGILRLIEARKSV